MTYVIRSSLDDKQYVQVLSGEYILRLAVGAPLTEVRHVNAAWQILQEKATALLENL
jgi:tyrosine decarboxylase